ncbi:MAG: adenylate/guanylate cyclase domain-containing protein [Acidimicrobiia bacterium]|nr:adenylate/guanylate cyclase domain-containing protein [Acidimicrobiia bacterium]
MFSSVLIGGAAVLWGSLYLALGEPLAASIPLSYSALSAISIGLFARHTRYRLFRSSQLALTLILPFLLSVALGGLANSSAVVVWSFTSPLGALVFGGRAKLWFGAFLSVVVAAGVLEPILDNEQTLPTGVVVVFFVLNLSAVAAITFILMQYFTSQRESAFNLLSNEQERSEALLLNILPKQIAEALKQSPTTIADYFEGASVLFADVVAFTPMSAQMTPTELVELLNEVFTYFDRVADELGIEKIKTIGDAYMAAAGVPAPRADHAQALTRMALRVRDHFAANTVKGQQLAFRIGINSGPLVAGVIGTRKFIYDLWGDAVNTASRMESHGSQGAVQITRATYELIEGEFECEPKGTVVVKGKGDMEVWHVVRAR